jgi:hypothetical protein
MIGHARFIAAALQEKLRKAIGVQVTLSHRDGETLLIWGGTDEENQAATHWIHDRLRSLGADARILELDSEAAPNSPRRAVTWAVIPAREASVVRPRNAA